VGVHDVHGVRRGVPAFIDIVDTIIDLRRYLTLSEGALPSTAPQSLQNMQRAGNPWGLPAAERLAWRRASTCRSCSPARRSSTSTGSAARRRTTSATSHRALGGGHPQEGGRLVRRDAGGALHGEVARRLGEEYLYQTVQADNVAAMNQYKFRKVITHCRTASTRSRTSSRNSGDVRGAAPLAGHRRPRAERPHQADQAGDGTVVFHDSCYLGRYNGIMDAPRRAAAAVPGLRVIDPRTRASAALLRRRGGHMWMEVKSEKRVNIIRTEELLATGARTVATACPFCLAMLDLGRKVVGRRSGWP